jgi:hypothetical protein
MHATPAELAAYLPGTITAPTEQDALRVLQQATDLVDLFVVRAYDPERQVVQDSLRDATLAQALAFLEREQSGAGSTGTVTSVRAGDAQVTFRTGSSGSTVAGRLSPLALGALARAGLASQGVTGRVAYRDEPLHGL